MTDFTPDMGPSSRSRSAGRARSRRHGPRLDALRRPLHRAAYLALLLVLPIALVFVPHLRARPRAGASRRSRGRRSSRAFWLTLPITAIAVPLNTIFGVDRRARRWCGSGSAGAAS